eukprot:11661258-Alexandrium_andersonii.AAC.1
MAFLSFRAILPEAMPSFLKNSCGGQMKPPEERLRKGRQRRCPRSRRTSLSEVRRPEGSRARRRLEWPRRPSP